jgi:hypothetical protein
LLKTIDAGIEQEATYDLAVWKWTRYIPVARAPRLVRLQTSESPRKGIVKQVAAEKRTNEMPGSFVTGVRTAGRSSRWLARGSEPRRLRVHGYY